MKKISIFGAGRMSKPLVDYFIDTCGYEVFILNRTVSKGEAFIDGRSLGHAVRWEVGEVPGIDHFGTQLLLDEIRREGARIEVDGSKLFENFWLEDIPGLGVFETYPNKDCKKYLEPFGLDENVTFYRGLLRYSGYCNTMKNIKELGFFNSTETRQYAGKTYRQLMASLIGAASTGNLEKNVAEYLNVFENADIIHRLKWLGLLDDRLVDIQEGSLLDVLLDRMLKKMKYKTGEMDMIIVHIEATVEFPDGRKEKRTATMKVEGDALENSAMSRAVALPAAIAAKLILNGNITGTGCKMPPTLPQLYKPLLDELVTFGYAFKRGTVKLN